MQYYTEPVCGHGREIMIMHLKPNPAGFLRQTGEEVRHSSGDVGCDVLVCACLNTLHKQLFENKCKQSGAEKPLHVRECIPLSSC